MNQIDSRSCEGRLDATDQTRTMHAPLITRTRLQSKLGSLTTVSVAVLATLMVAQGHTYQPSNWVNNPFNANRNFGVQNANSSSPVFTNNGIHLGTLYGHSPIGWTVRLADPGDMVTFSGQVTLVGIVNPQGNMQFRIGLYSRGDSTGDTNWLGHMIGNPTGTGGEGASGLYIRNNPNPGIYGSGLAGNTTPASNASWSYSPQ